MKHLRFAEKHVPKILEGEKWVTVRYNPFNFSPQDSVRLMTEDGERFAIASIYGVYEMTVRKYVRWSPNGHRDYHNTAEACKALNDYYSDQIGPETDITILFFSLKK